MEELRISLRRRRIALRCLLEDEDRWRISDGTEDTGTDEVLSIVRCDRPT